MYRKNVSFEDMILKDDVSAANIPASTEASISITARVLSPTKIASHAFIRDTGEGGDDACMCIDFLQDRIRVFGRFMLIIAAERE